MTIPQTMKAIRLHAPGVDGLRFETIETPQLRAGEVLVEVHAAAVTRDELEWPLDRLPAVPSYELSGVVATAGDLAEISVGEEVYALTPFDSDGVAAEYAAVGVRLIDRELITAGNFVPIERDGPRVWIDRADADRLLRQRSSGRER